MVFFKILSLLFFAVVLVVILIFVVIACYIFLGFWHHLCFFVVVGRSFRGPSFQSRWRRAATTFRACWTTLFTLRDFAMEGRGWEKDEGWDSHGNWLVLCVRWISFLWCCRIMRLWATRKSDYHQWLFVSCRWTLSKKAWTKPWVVDFHWVLRVIANRQKCDVWLSLQWYSML